MSSDELTPQFSSCKPILYAPSPTWLYANVCHASAVLAQDQIVQVEILLVRSGGSVARSANDRGIVVSHPTRFH